MENNKYQKQDELLNLTKAKVNCFYNIKFVNCTNNIERRLYDLGFVEGEKIRIIKKSIFNGVYLVEIMGGVLAIKRKEIEKIWITSA